MIAKTPSESLKLRILVKKQGIWDTENNAGFFRLPSGIPDTTSVCEKYWPKKLIRL